MAKSRVARLAFNRGLVDPLGLARADIKRLAFAAEVHTNWIVRVLGSMSIRPGLEHLGGTRSNLRPFHIPFVFSISDKAGLEFTDQAMRVWIDDDVVTRAAVSTAVVNGSFDINVAGWTDASEAGATVAWQAGGYLGLTGNGTSYAILRQQLAVAAADQNVEHGLHIVIERGPVVLRVGSTSGDDDYINETELEEGAHSLAVTPTGASIWVEFKSRLERIVLVDSCTIEGAGDMVVGTPWLEADLRKLRHDASGDVTFMACDGYQQRKIERRAARSWSVVLYKTSDGPFQVENVGATTLTASALTGNITLTASKPLFRAGHVGALFRHVSVGQRVEKEITAQNVFSDTIRITGVDSARVFTLVITGLSGTGSTVTLQGSLDEPGNWTDSAPTYVADTTVTVNDQLDNQIVYYRIGVKTGDYAGGTIETALQIGIGSITGAVRITDVTSSTVAEAEVLTALGSLTATEQWSEGRWSTLKGFPTAVGFHDGRLVWAGRERVQLSVSDAFDGFDPEYEGDAAPIDRSVGSGPVDTISWVLSLQRLILGGQAAEFSVRASSLDEPLTPTQFNPKVCGTEGAADVAAVKIDQNGVFVQRGGVRVYMLSFGDSGIDYEPSDLSALVPDIGSPGIVKMVVQRQPDTRLHCIRSDGTVALLVFDKLENVICWTEVETDGVVEDAYVLPGGLGEKEDLVYYSVARTIDGVTQHYLEKWAFEADTHGAAVCKLADSFVVYTGAATTVISVPHLVGEQVVVWANGVDVGTASDGSLTYTVSAGGTITLATAATNVVVGLPYSAPWKSAKFVELMEQFNAAGLLSNQQVKGLGLIMAHVHAQGLKYGPTLVEADMCDLPVIEQGRPVDPNAVRADYAEAPIAFPGTWSSDARLCLLAKAPRPVTVLAAIAEVEHHG